MRDFMIGSFEFITKAVVIVLGVAVTIGGIATTFGGGLFVGLAVLLVGWVYVVMVGGFMFMILGVYHNTKRMADALEQGKSQPHEHSKG